MSGLEAEWCSAETAFKQTLAIVTVIGVALILGVAAVLTHFFVQENRNGAKAFQSVVDLFRREVSSTNPGMPSLRAAEHDPCCCKSLGAHR